MPMLADVMVIQLTLLIAIHAQRSSENTLNAPIPPLAENAEFSGETE